MMRPAYEFRRRQIPPAAGTRWAGEGGWGTWRGLICVEYQFNAQMHLGT